MQMIKRHLSNQELVTEDRIAGYSTFDLEVHHVQIRRWLCNGFSSSIEETSLFMEWGWDPKGREENFISLLATPEGLALARP
jgi:hypothetical protein